MELKSEIELVHTRRKLKELEALQAAASAQTGGGTELRQISTQSLMRLINQLEEEIARFEARYGAHGR